jgi:ribonuclease HI
MVVPARAGESYLAWFDGACEPVNPGGTASFGVVITDNAGTVLVKEHGIAGKGSAMSNNVAEYAGVLHVLKYLSSRPPGRVTIHGDSNLVINQLNGKWRIKKGLYLSIALETKELLAYLRGLGWQINFCWIPREQNEECDALSKKTVDKPDSGVWSGFLPIDPSLPGRSVSEVLSCQQPLKYQYWSTQSSAVGKFPEWALQPRGSLASTPSRTDTSPNAGQLLVSDTKTDESLARCQSAVVPLSGKGVYHSKSGESPAQHIFRVRP